jgi:asparagine synthase (glutamine-hydrolysing)
MPGLRKKNLLRKAMEGLLPPAVLKKKKVGLEMPYSAWFRGPLREFARETMLSSGAVTGGLLRKEGVKALWEEHQEMRRDNGRALWGLLNYTMWYDLYISSSDYMDHVLAGRGSG